MNDESRTPSDDAGEALERVGMADFRKRQIGELSGGQKKRVFLARSLAQDGKVILLELQDDFDPTAEQLLLDQLGLDGVRPHEHGDDGGRDDEQPGQGQSRPHGGLSDARTFALEDGLTWLDPAGRTRTVTELDEWKGARAAAGRMAPRGFPQDNRFT